MEIATRASHLFPKDRRVKTKGVSYNLTNFSRVSSFLPKIPKLELDEPQISSRTGRYGKDKYDVVAATNKRQHSGSGEENPPEKRQKKTVDTERVTKTEFTKPVDARAITTKVTKPENSITVSSEACLHETEAKPNVTDLRNLIAKAQHQIQRKRQVDQRREYITRQRIAARIALNQVVATDSFDDHLNYHRELQQSGCTFIKDQVACLNMFNSWSRSDYNGVTNSVFNKNQTPWFDEDSRRNKHQRATNVESSESAESSNQKQSKCRSSTSVRI